MAHLPVKLLICVAVSLALVAACGGDDDGGASRTPTSSPTASPTPVPTPGLFIRTTQPGLPVTLPLNDTGRDAGYTMFVDGTNLVALGPDVVISPDGQWIAGKDRREGEFDLLWVAKRDATGRRDIDIQQPGTIVWAPDSSMFVVSGLTTTGETLPDQPEIPVTRDFLVFASSGASTETSVAGYPAWSPDSTRFAIAGETGVVYDVSEGKALEFASDVSNVNVPSWSPDGELVAYIGGSGDGVDVFISKPNGDDRRQLTDDPEEEWRPSFSPDGKYVAFHDDSGDRVFSLVVANVETGAISTLIAGGDTAAGMANLVWTDDGRLLIVGPSPLEEGYVHIADLNTTAMYALIAQPVADLRQMDDGGLTFTLPAQP